MNLSPQALIKLEEEVEKYTNDLLERSTELAKQATIPDEITPSHIEEAKIKLWAKPVKPARFNFYDISFSVGCAFLGVTIKSIMDIHNKISTLNSSVIILALLCGLLLGIGVIGKAKQN
jgi:hypothetical protein